MTAAYHSVLVMMAGVVLAVKILIVPVNQTVILIVVLTAHVMI